MKGDDIMLIHIEDKKGFDKEISEGKVLVDFFATWCGPCSMLSPLVEKLAEEHPELKVLKVDVDRVQEAAAAFDVYSIPTLIYFENGQPVRKTVGYIPEPGLKKFAGVK
jgi:thioredoxin 1